MDRSTTARLLTASASAAVLSVTLVGPAHAAPARSGFSPSGSVSCGTGEPTSVVFSRSARTPATFVSQHGVQVVRQVTHQRFTLDVYRDGVAESVTTITGSLPDQIYGGGPRGGMRLVPCSYSFTSEFPVTVSADSAAFLEADGVDVADYGEDLPGPAFESGARLLLHYVDTGSLLVQAVGKR